jgi:hypothetical protein
VTGTINEYRGGTETQPRRCDSGAVLVDSTVIGNAPPIYKNQGWYATGGVFEEWISVGLPSAFPPSAHALTELTFVVLQQ